MKKHLAFGLSVAVSALALVSQPAWAEDVGDWAEVKTFVDLPSLPLSIDEIDRRGLRSARADRQPWSDTYWPDQAGSVAAPYAADGYPGLPWGFSRNRSFVSGFLTWGAESFDQLSDADVSVMSPAQKYDLLVGDRDFTFS